MTEYRTEMLDDKGNPPARGDHWQVRGRCRLVPEGDSIVRAALTIKRGENDSDEDAVVAIQVTAASSDFGAIEDAGGEPDETAPEGIGTPAIVRFQVPPSAQEEIKAKKKYAFDIQYVSAAGIVYTGETGWVTPGRDITIDDGVG